jgi:hypothetical protein
VHPGPLQYGFMQHPKLDEDELYEELEELDGIL